jgi:hypothetical protein
MEVEPADGNDRLADRPNYVAYARTSLRIRHGRHQPRRLVIHEVHVLAGAREKPSAHLDVVMHGVGPRAELGDDFAVDADLACQNPLFGLAA